MAFYFGIDYAVKFISGLCKAVPLVVLHVDRLVDLDRFFFKTLENSLLQLRHNIWLPFTMKPCLLTDIETPVEFAMVHCILQTQVEFAIFLYLLNCKISAIGIGLIVIIESAFLATFRLFGKAYNRGDLQLEDFFVWRILLFSFYCYFSGTKCKAGQPSVVFTLKLT